jgi:DNA-binding transcriptional LysR family regulator
MEMRDKPTGSVRMKLSDHALESIVWPKLRPILKNYPDIKLELNSENGSKNIVEEKFDAGVCVGECLEKDMITVRIGPDWRLVTVASPEYLAKKTAPETPRDLILHDCINYRQARPRALDVWEFEKDGGEVRARVDGQLAFNTYGVMIDAAVSGYGIAYVPESLVGEEVASGKLVQVLDDWTSLFPGYYLYYPSWRLNSPAFKVVVDALSV